MRQQIAMFKGMGFKRVGFKRVGFKRVGLCALSGACQVLSDPKIVLCGLLFFGINAWAQDVNSEWDVDSEADASLYEPDVVTQDIREVRIDSENLEMGLFFGFVSVEDFEVGGLYGAHLTYHANELLFMEFSAAQSTAVETAFERLSGSVQLIPDDENQLLYYQLSVGLNVLPGEFFWRKNRAWNMALYVLGGGGVTEFAGDNYFTVHGGMGLRWLLTDWMAVNTRFQVQAYETDILGEADTSINMSWLTGVSFFF